MSGYRVDGAEGVLTRNRNRLSNPSFTPQCRGGRDESASYTVVELCACVHCRASEAHLEVLGVVHSLRHQERRERR
jgi:hypothetical protein